MTSASEEGKLGVEAIQSSRRSMLSVQPSRVDDNLESMSLEELREELEKQELIQKIREKKAKTKRKERQERQSAEDVQFKGRERAAQLADFEDKVQHEKAKRNLELKDQEIQSAEDSQLSAAQLINDKLISSVVGCKGEVGLLVGMFHPLLGAAIAMSSSSESQDDIQRIRLALKKGADINYRDKDSWTALMHASYGGYPGIVQFLLDNGAQKNLTVTQRTVRNWIGYTALRISEYYLKSYQNSRAQCKPDMIEHYDALILRYQRVGEILQ